MKKIIYLIATFATLLVGAGCSKSYLDINKNPNLPGDGAVTTEMMLPLILERTARSTGAGYVVQARWMGYWARGGDFGQTADEERYQLTTAFGAGTWNTWYDILFDNYTMARKANAGNRQMYEAISKVVKVIGFMNIVDVYNNAPYTQAFNLSQYILPAYDKGEDIYKDLFVQLDDALTLMNAYPAGSDLTLANTDIMFKGNVTMWKKLVNTLRLKLLIHVSEVNIVDRAAQIAKITAEGYLMSGESANVNPGYKKSLSGSGASQQNPFWDNYKANVDGIEFDNYNRANNYVLNKMKATNDIRYQYFFSPAKEPANPANPYIGYDYGVPTSSVPSRASSAVSGPGLARSVGQDQWYFTSVESMFLQAEATFRDWIPGDKKAAYDAAVRESFRWLGVTNADATAATYLAGPGLYNGTLAQIIGQKHLALIGINNLEAWTDYRRTGFPADVPLSLNPAREANIPKRYLYPQSEYNVNATNVGAQGTINPLTSGVFWDL